MQWCNLKPDNKKAFLGSKEVQYLFDINLPGQKTEV